MFTSFVNWFNKQADHLDSVHAKISWEEALDTAIQSINDLKEIESETGIE